MAFDENSIVELGKRPISDAAPCGQDVADDEEYLQLEAELTKLDRIDLGEPDWHAIESLSLSILRTKSKDVQVACALGQTLQKRQRYAGLAAALGLLADMIDTFWDGLFPERPRRRKSRIEALAEGLVESGAFAGDGRPQPDEFDALDRCLERIEHLKTSLTAKMPDDAPDFNKFTRKLKELAAERPKPAPEPAPAAAEAAPTAAPRPAAAGGAGGFVAGEVQDVSGAVSAILGAATFIRKADPTHPLAYAIVRLNRWARIELPTNDAAMHQIEPPEKTMVEALVHQHKNGLWEHLLNGAEGAFRSSDPLWLDLQRYACAAMQGLGPQFEPPRKAILGLTAWLVGRLGSGVYGLTFRGGMPLVSGETKLWIEAEVATAQGGGGSGGAAAADGRLTEAWEGARKLAGSGKLGEAVKGLVEGLGTCAQRRDRFLWRVRIARLLLDAQRLQLAAPLLEECFEEIRRYHIDDWEPTLAAEAAQLLYRCRKGLAATEKPTPEDVARVRDSFAWLCQLDPLAALAAEPAGK